MNKKLNIFNTVISIIVIGVYIYYMITKGQEFLLDYNVNMLYIGAGIGIVLFMFSLFKLLRDSIWMDLIYMIYVGLFIGFYIYGLLLGKNWNLYAIFKCYPIWIVFMLGGLLILNIVFFILSFKEEK